MAEVAVDEDKQVRNQHNCVINSHVILEYERLGTCKKNGWELFFRLPQQYACHHARKRHKRIVLCTKWGRFLTPGKFLYQFFFFGLIDMFSLL